MIYNRSNSFNKKIYECGKHNKNRWMELIEVRNEIAHEHSFNQDAVVDNINLIYEKSDELVAIYYDLYEFLKIIERKQ